MSEQFIFPLSVEPGINRDQTFFESKKFIGGYNVRFYGGKVTKRGGFKEFYPGFDQITRSLLSVVQAQTKLFPSNLLLAATEFDENKNGKVYILPVESVINFNLQIGPYIDISPINDNLLPPLKEDGLWQIGTLRTTEEGISLTSIIALPTLNSNNLFSSNDFPLYECGLNDSLGSTTLIKCDSSKVPQVSGGFLVLEPILLLYGNNGTIYYSRNYQLDFRVKDDSPIFRFITISSDKIVAVRPIIGQGIGPTALAWSMTQVFLLNYSPDTSIVEDDSPGSLLSTSFNVNASLIAVNSIVSYNNMYFWIGNDGFYVYNGVIKKLENYTNLLWFLNNLDLSQSNKIFSFTDSTFGEITWVFPTRSGSRHAIVYNVEGDFWYDTPLERSAALMDNRLPYPILTDSLKRYNSNTARYYLEEISNDGIYLLGGGQEVRVPIPFSFTTPFITLFLKEVINLQINTFYPNFILPPNPEILYQIEFKGFHTPNGEAYTRKLTSMNYLTEVINEVRLQGRLINMTVSCDTLGSYIRMGLPILECSLGDKRR